MIGFLVYLLIVAIVMSLGWWILSMIPLPPPVKQIVTVIFVVVCAIILIYLLLGLTGPLPRLNWPR